MSAEYQAKIFLQSNQLGYEQFVMIPSRSLSLSTGLGIIVEHIVRIGVWMTTTTHQRIVSLHEVKQIFSSFGKTLRELGLNGKSVFVAKK